MTRTFLIDDEVHAVDDVGCPACRPEYPERCPCGGLMHAAGEPAGESETVFATRCDRCGRSMDDLADEVA
jgi:hypothetical protein